MAATRQLLRLAKPRTVACIGRNYADHIAELGNTKPAEPFFFLKPASSLLQPAAGAAVLSPRGADLHYEVELAAVVGAVGADTVKPADALARVKGWAVAVDMTARNWQEAVKKKGLPWTLCKGLKTFLPVSHFIPLSALPAAQHNNVELWLRVNGVDRQRDSTALMLWDTPQLLAHVSSVAPLEEDDLLLTGTPKGVGRVVPGDIITAGVKVDGVELEEGRIEVRIEERTDGYGS